MSIKRTIITTLVALAVVAVVAPAAAQALTVQDLQTQIAQLEAQLGTLQGQEQAGTTTGILPANCVGIDFNRNLSRDAVGSDVKCLQSILNQLNVNVADAGAGSPGHETTYFGGATRAAVIRFQEMFSISPAVGYVGPLTLAKLNSLLMTWRTAPVVTPTPTGLCPNGNTLASNCATPPAVTPTPTPTGLCPNGNTLASNCLTGPTTPVVGTTGFLSLNDIAATPASNANVTATSNVPVLGLDLKAIGANLTVSSAKIALAVTKSTVTQYPSTLVNTLNVYDGSTLLGTYPVNSSTVIQDSTNAYYMILSGFNFQIPGNTTKTLTITADFPTSLDTSRSLVIGLYGASDAIRATDPSGAYSTAGGSASARTYTVTYTTVGTSVLTATIDPNTPVSTDVAVNATGGTSNVPASVFDLKSTTGASSITKIVLTVTGDNAAVAKVNAVDLYDGTTLLGSQSLSGVVTGSTATFNNLTIPVTQDSTKILTAKVDMASGVTSATKLRVSIATSASDVTYNEPNMSSTTATGTATGNYMYFYDGGATAIGFVSAVATYSADTTNSSAGVASGVVTFNFQANGGTTTEPVAGDFTVVACANSDTTCASPVAVSTAIQVTPANTTSGIANGGTASVAINASFGQAGHANGYYYFKVTAINWAMTGVTESTATTTLSGTDNDSSAITNWKTNPVYVH